MPKRDRRSTLPIRAAGGVLERRAHGGVEIAVIRRSRYAHRDGTPGDWSLPKGKLHRDESTSDGALREVREETGCHARILPDGETYEIEYEVNRRPKTVTFFRMTSDGPAGAPDPREVSEVVWLAPAVAAERLTYAGEREVVLRAFGLSG